jgi:hypothetical protein
VKGPRLPLPLRDSGMYSWVCSPVMSDAPAECRPRFYARGQCLNHTSAMLPPSALPGTLLRGRGPAQFVRTPDANRTVSPTNYKTGWCHTGRRTAVPWMNMWQHRDRIVAIYCPGGDS